MSNGTENKKSLQVIPYALAWLKFISAVASAVADGLKGLEVPKKTDYEK